MPLDEFETEELSAAYNMLQKDGTITEARVKECLDILGAGMDENAVHDMFMVGGGKNGFSKETWMKAFEHKDHGDQDEEVTTAFNCVSAGGSMDFDKAKKILDFAGLELKPKEFEEFKNISDYNSDGKVDQGDFVNMIHAMI